MCLLNVYSGQLPPTKSHKVRSWAFLPDATGEYLGTLSISQGRELDSYGIEEDTSEPFPGRAFLLAKSDTEGDVYRVILNPDRSYCSGLYCGRGAACKHRDAVRVALEAGAFDS